MADYANSVLVTAQAMLAAKFAAPEMRHKDYSIVRTLLKGKAAFDTDVNVMKTSDGRAIEAYCLSKRASDAAAARSATHTAASNGDSLKVALTWATKAEKFKTSLKQSENNLIKDAERLANLMQSAWINLLDSLEGVEAAYLDTQKTAINVQATGELGEFIVPNNIFKVGAKNRAWFFQYAQAMMAGNNYSSMIDIISDPVGYAIAKQLANQGPQNGSNTSFQFSDMNISQSSSLTPINGYLANMYAIPEGTVGLITHVPALNQQNKSTRLQTYTSMSDPFGLGITAALHFYEAAADTQATGGALQDEVTQFELSIDYSNVIAPLSVATETPIFQIGLENVQN